MSVVTYDPLRMEFIELIFAGFMAKVWPLLVFLIVLSLIIFIHELGHFLAARWAKVYVEEFAIGMGPKILKKQGKETLYTINAIPVGGFVRMRGEEDVTNDPDGFGEAPLYKRIIITLAGVFMNFLSAWIVLTLLFTAGTQPFLVSKDDVRNAFIDQKIGFETEEYGLITADSEWGEKVKTGWETQVVPEGLEEVDLRLSYLENVKLPLYKAAPFAFTEMFRISAATVERVSKLPGEIIRNRALPDDIGGPVRIAHITYEIIPEGFIPLVKLFIMISISLAVMNLLPIPALDGGRFFFQIIEGILMPFKLKISPKIENYIHLSGFILVMGLIVAITWNDIVYIVQVNNWFGQ